MLRPRLIAVLLLAWIVCSDLGPVLGQVPNPVSPPHFSQTSAAFTEPFSAALSSDFADGVIRFTLDRSVPNAFSAVYAGPLTITNTTLLRAKVFRPGLVPSQTVSESYFLLHTNDDFEFVELQNIGARRLNLVGLQFQIGIRFVFPNLDLNPGQTVVVVKNLAAFATRYDTNGLIIAGEFDGNLDNGGEELALQDAAGRTIFDFAYDDERSWTKSADGNGYSLELVDPRGDHRFPGSWRASQDVDGTPGRSGFARLEVQRLTAEPGMLKLMFKAEAGKVYTVHYRDGLNPSSWNALRQVSAVGQDRVVELTEPITPGTRFYRLASP